MAVDTSDLVAALEAARDAIADEAALLVVEWARADAPVSTPSETNHTSGTLRDSLAVLDSWTEGTSAFRTVGVPDDSPAAEYAAFTDEVDTAPHIITAVNAPVLRFFWEDGPAGPGVYHYRFVHHPGTRGQRWFASQNADRWERAVQAAGSAYNG